MPPAIGAAIRFHMPDPAPVELPKAGWRGLDKEPGPPAGSITFLVIII
jgi:hypothetical protein